MSDGTVQLWREQSLLQSGSGSSREGDAVQGGAGDSVELRVEEGAVTSLQFCPLEEGGKLAWYVFI